MPDLPLPSAALDWLQAETHCSEHAARQALEYVAAQQAAIATVPTQTQVVFERFFDESGGMQLVVHAPFGSRINRAWGLAMRKRFCRSFDFELQATADDDGFILSLGPQHSFPIESLFQMLRTDNAKSLLEQALLAVPMFRLRWRWNVTRALQVERMHNGKRVPPALQRFRSEDLLTAVFPKLTGCQEEHTGDHVLPDHPLVDQTMHDCLHEALDLDGLIDVLDRVQRGEIAFVARDTREPSPFAYELLNANPYAFLDGGEVQERRARMAATQRTLTVESMRDLGRLDPAAIEQVVAEAQPLVRDADELHDLLLSRILLPTPEAAQPQPAANNIPAFDSHRQCIDGWRDLFGQLVATGRATNVYLAGRSLGWTATERWPAVQAMFPEAGANPPVTVPSGVRHDWTEEEARVSLVRGLMEFAGPTTAAEIASLTGITEPQADAALQALEGEGVVLQGKFRSQESGVSSQQGVNDESRMTNDERNTPSSLGTSSFVIPEWCHRRLLSRIHRLTVSGLRREIEPVDVATYIRFLLRYHGIDGDQPRQGINGVYESIGQLQGLDIPAAAWERHVLPQRVRGYRREWLDELCLTGEVGWGRLHPPPRDPDKARGMAGITRAAPLSIFLREDLPWLLSGAPAPDAATLGSTGQYVVELLSQRGAMFATDLLAAAELVPAQLDDVLGELVTRGFVTADGFAGLRGLVRESHSSNSDSHSRGAAKLVRRRRSAATTGRWSLWRTSNTSPPIEDPQARREWVEHWAWQLLRRWGVVFRDLLTRESGVPQWWELTQVYRRLEARGEIRGGRFVTGVGGEQYAVSEAVQALRTLRRDQSAPAEANSAPEGRSLRSISAADPLNLVGIITRHPRVPSLTSNRVIYLDGVLMADVQAGRLTLYDDCPAAIVPEIERLTAPPEQLPSLPTAAASPENSPTNVASPESTSSTPSHVAAPEPPLNPRSDDHSDQPSQDRHAERFARRSNKTPRPPRFPRPLIS